MTGLSAVEVFPATPTHVTLTANPLLVDGDKTANTGVDVGFGLAALGDSNAREVGVEFGGPATEVSAIDVWFDSSLTPEVSGAFTGSVTVYDSADNLNWTGVALAGAPALSVSGNVLEISIVPVSARFLKAVLRPLPAGVTLDTKYRSLFVTEVEFSRRFAAK